MRRCSGQARTLTFALVPRAYGGHGANFAPSTRRRARRRNPDEIRRASDEIRRNLPESVVRVSAQYTRDTLGPSICGPRFRGAQAVIRDVPKNHCREIRQCRQPPLTGNSVDGGVLRAGRKTPDHARHGGALPRPTDLCTISTRAEGRFFPRLGKMHLAGGGHGQGSILNRYPSRNAGRTDLSEVISRAERRVHRSGPEPLRRPALPIYLKSLCDGAGPNFARRSRA